MAMTKLDQPLSLSLSAENWAQTMSRAIFALPSLRPHAGAQVALQRCPILRTSAWSLPYSLIHPSNRGHLYFAEQGTFLLCIDNTILSG